MTTTDYTKTDPPPDWNPNENSQPLEVTHILILKLPGRNGFIWKIIMPETVQWAAVSFPTADAAQAHARRYLDLANHAWHHFSAGMAH